MFINKKIALKKKDKSCNKIFKRFNTKVLKEKHWMFKKILF